MLGNVFLKFRIFQEFGITVDWIEGWIKLAVGAILLL
jgi:hypothetical protein